MNDLLGALERIISTGITKVGVVVQRASLNDDSIQSFKFDNVDIYMRPWHVEKEVKPMLDELSKLGVQGIVGTKTSAEVAKTYGIPGEVLDTGAAAMKTAINEALRRVAKAQETERVREQERAKQIQGYHGQYLTGSGNKTTRIHLMQRPVEGFQPPVFFDGDIVSLIAGVYDYSSGVIVEPPNGK